MTDELTQELAALAAVVEALQPFDQDTRLRMGRYIWSRINDEDAWGEP